MGLRKATFADGTTWVYDPEVNAAATHYNEHRLVDEADVADGTPLGFTDPADTPADFVPAEGS